jgi:hypothetical protein
MSPAQKSSPVLALAGWFGDASGQSPSSPQSVNFLDDRAINILENMGSVIETPAVLRRIHKTGLRRAG